MFESEERRFAAWRHELQEGGALTDVEVLFQDVPQPGKHNLHPLTKLTLIYNVKTINKYSYLVYEDE
jgi:hypothetical protein